MALKTRLPEYPSFRKRVGRASPIAEPEYGREDPSSSKYFGLFLSAVSHEVANALMGLQSANLNGLSDGENRIISEAIRNYTRLRGLNSLSHEMDTTKLEGKLSLLFPDSGICLEGMSTEWVEGFLLGLKIKTIQELRLSLFAIEAGVRESVSDPVFSSSLDRALTCGNLLCNALEKIVRGDYDLSSERVAQKVIGKSSLLQALTRASAEAGVRIDIPEIDPSLCSATVSSNPLITHLVFTNILSNARRASEIAGKEPLVRLFITEECDRVCLRFVDYGAGMDATMKEMLNRGVPFTTKEGCEGETHGAGFNYCRSLAQRLGGALSVEWSEAGKGTTILFELKRAHDGETVI